MAWSDRGRRQPAVLSRGMVNQRRHKPDYQILLLSSILLSIGLIVVYAISPGLASQKQVSDNYYIGKQVMAILLGVVAFLIMANVPVRTWQRLQRPLIIVATAITIMALVLPASIDYPAHRWIRFAGFSLQSVEFIKFTLLICLASFLSNKAQNGQMADKNTLKPLLVVLGLLGAVVGLAQKDFGSAAVIVAIVATMSFIAGLPIKRVLLTAVLIVVASMLLILPFSYRRDRVLNFIHPEQNCLTSGYQACQALIAVGSGGLFGKGLAHSVQAYGYLPEAANDSIFAIFAEKFGFVGVTILIVFFMALFTRLKNIMERTSDTFSRLIVTGIMAWISVQVIINIGAMMGLLPLKGITLPFVSYGGTSVLFVMAVIGLAFNISRYTNYTSLSEVSPSRKKETGYALNYSTRRPS